MKDVTVKLTKVDYVIEPLPMPETEEVSRLVRAAQARLDAYWEAQLLRLMTGPPEPSRSSYCLIRHTP